MNYLRRTLFLLLCLVFTASVYASGFRIPETSVAGTGLANAIVANYKEIGSIPYNPANMSFIDGRNLQFGAAQVSSELHVEPDSGIATDSIHDTTLLIPHYYYISTLDNTWSYGLNINVPFGLETKWPDETFTSFAGPLDPLEPEASSLHMVNFNPNVSYRSGNTSFAFGLDYYDVRELVFNTQDIKITGEGGDIGWNISFQHVAGPWSFGGSYRSAIEIDLSGTVSVATFVSNATANIELPSILQLGARYTLNRDWSVEFDIDRTGWSVFDTFEINHSLPVPTGVASPITSTNNWQNSNAYRLGFEYRTDPKGKLRFGYSRDERAQSDDYFTARVPDSDRQLFSAGYVRHLKYWSFELSYMYVKFDERDFNSTSPPAAEPNGTSAFNGMYDSNVSLFGLSFTLKL